MRGEEKEGRREKRADRKEGSKHRDAHTHTQTDKRRFLPKDERLNQRCK